MFRALRAYKRADYRINLSKCIISPEPLVGDWTWRYEIYCRDTLFRIGIASCNARCLIYFMLTKDIYTNLFGYMPRFHDLIMPSLVYLTTKKNTSKKTNRRIYQSSY